MRVFALNTHNIAIEFVFHLGLFTVLTVYRIQMIERNIAKFQIRRSEIFFRRIHNNQDFTLILFIQIRINACVVRQHKLRIALTQEIL